MPASWQFGRPMHVHRNVPGARVDAKVELGLEQRLWMVVCTSGVGAAVTAGAEGRRGAAHEQMRGRGVRGASGGA
jgi:hypothetical protein